VNGVSPELLYRFESIGDNCELGLVQRHYGAEPLGLLRWARVSFDALSRALDERFSAMGHAKNLQVHILNTEYLVQDASYRITYHPFIDVTEMTPAELVSREVTRIAFLRDKLLADLRKADKIMVYKQNENLDQAEMWALWRQLQTHGPNKLLCVVSTDDPRRAGSVELIDDGLAVGFIDRFGSYENLTAYVSYACWGDICAQADLKLSAVSTNPTSVAI
jgi:hypothetical protein